MNPAQFRLQPPVPFALGHDFPGKADLAQAQQIQFRGQVGALRIGQGHFKGIRPVLGQIGNRQAGEGRGGQGYRSLNRG